MKTLFRLLLFVLLFTGCSKDEDNTPTPAPTVTNPPDTASYSITEELTVTAVNPSDTNIVPSPFLYVDTMISILHGLTPTDSATVYNYNNSTDTIYYANVNGTGIVSSVITQGVQNYPLLDIRRVLQMIKI